MSEEKTGEITQAQKAVLIEKDRENQRVVDESNTPFEDEADRERARVLAGVNNKQDLQLEQDAHAAEVAIHSEIYGPGMESHTQQEEARLEQLRTEVSKAPAQKGKADPVPQASDSK